MPTRSELENQEGQAPDEPKNPSAKSARGDARLPSGQAFESTPERKERLAVRSQGRTLQTAIDEAVARAFIYRFLAKAYEYPTAEGWGWLSNTMIQWVLASALNTLAPARGPLRDYADDLACRLNADNFEPFTQDYVAAFGHAARGSCPLNEIEYGDLKADPLFQPHRLADLAAFYRAFGLELTSDAAERQDHVCLELEFMSVLAAKEAYAFEHQLDDEPRLLCRAAQKDFLREHLGRWTPAFTRRLCRAVGQSTLGALARLTQEFVAMDCSRFGVTPGSEDLLLRPVDEAEESPCASCGIKNLPPGALMTRNG